MSKAKLTKVNKSFYGKNYVVKDFDLAVNEKDFLVIIDSSGCGKTTLLNFTCNNKHNWYSA